MERPRVFCACLLWVAFQVLSGPSPAWSDDDIYDRFYDDDTTTTLNFLPGQVNIQVHNLWQPGDEDWAKFNVISDAVYAIRVTDQASSCDAIIYLFHESNLTTPLVVRDDWGPGIADEEIDWFSTSTSGTMFVMVTQSPRTPGRWGEGTTYTLRGEGTWGDNAGVPNISGTSQCTIGPLGGTLSVPSNPESAQQPVQKQQQPRYVYTKHQVVFPANALDRDYTFRIEAPEDIGNSPVEDYTSAWLSAHPGNASIVWIRIRSEFQPPLHLPAELTVQFVDDGPTTHGFTIDDLPPGADPSTMRIHTWTGSSWQLLDRPQWVVADTVSASIESLCDLPSPSGTMHMSLFAVAPTESTAAVKNWQLYP